MKIFKKITNKGLKIIDKILWTDYAVKHHNLNIGFHDSSYKFKETEIAFVHIPKTGGTSLGNILEKDANSRFVGLSYHRPISKYCPPHAYNYITVIRSPTDRVWSYYHMVRRSSHGYPYKRFAEKGLECFLDHCWEARNLACRYYSGEIKNEPDVKVLGRAFANLNMFVHVIDFDRFQGEATSIALKYNIPLYFIPHERKSQKNLINQSEKALIDSYNLFDLRLYNEWKNSQITKS